MVQEPHTPNLNRNVLMVGDFNFHLTVPTLTVLRNSTNCLGVVLRPAHHRSSPGEHVLDSLTFRESKRLHGTAVKEYPVQMPEIS